MYHNRSNPFGSDGDYLRGVNLSSPKAFKEAQIREEMINVSKNYSSELGKEIKELEEEIEKEKHSDAMQLLFDMKREKFDVDMDIIRLETVQNDYKKFVRQKWHDGLKSEFKEDKKNGLSM